MDFSDTQLDILFAAMVVSREGRAIVIEDLAYPAAHALAEAGWLRRRFVGDELAWEWTPQAEQALNMGALLQSAEGRLN